MTRFDVHIVARASKTSPAGWYGDVPRLRVNAPPADGAANLEAERALTKLLGSPVVLVAGGRSRRKTFETALPAATLDGLLKEVFGG